MKTKYTVTFNGHAFTRSSEHEYATAAIYQNVETGELIDKPSFAKAGSTPSPYCPAGIRPTERSFFKCYPRSVKYRAIFKNRLAEWEAKMSKYVLLTAPVEKI